MVGNSTLQPQSSFSQTPASSSYRVVADLLAKADVQINGERPWDMHFHRPGVPEQILARGNLGLGEAYMAADWDCERLDELFFRLLSARLDQEIQPLRLVIHSLRARFLNLQTTARAWQVGERHYDLGNNFYQRMLDPRMTYTCGYWRNAETLKQAQEAKLELICRKLQLQPGMRVLDIGCGWGSFMSYAAEHYGVECVGITISREQTDFVQARYAHLPLEFRLMDYRDLDEQFDRIASIGMFEHVGRKNHRTFMQVAHRCLAEDGLFLLHTIGKNVRNTVPDPWIDKYIFPNGDLPCMGQLADAADDLFVIEDVHNFGADYDRTLMAWYANFEQAWPEFSERLGERFFRMWRYYLLSCAGAFRARDIQLWQLVMTRSGMLGGYRRPE